MHTGTSGVFLRTVVCLAVDDILDGSPVGQREAARQTLRDQNISIITNALVTRVEPSEQLPEAAAASDSGRRAVHLKLPGEQSQVQTTPYRQPEHIPKVLTQPC